MHLMQYEITLPADYDMGIIHERVASRGSRTDDFPGLGFKAYLMRERGRDGSPVNQYAPFYLWAEVDGMNQFVFGPGFDGICNDFGRPTIRTWHSIAVCEGPARDVVPVAATRTVDSIGPGLSLIELSDRMGAEAARASRHPGVTCVVTGIDPSTWHRVTLTLWSRQVPEEAPGDRYAVLHVSEPGRTRPGTCESGTPQ
ncbi:MAG: DUF4865 family protein [Motilibacteraceae bacterium]